MSYESLFKLKTNPFRITPEAGSENLIWAGFPELKAKFEQRIRRSIQIPNSSLILNWGEYGSGKTHAAKYFSKKEVLNDLAKDKTMPFAMDIVFPKGKQPVLDIYTAIIDKIDIDEIRLKYSEVKEALSSFIEKTGENKHIQSILKAIFIGTKNENQTKLNFETDNKKNDDTILVKKYLYGTAKPDDLDKLKILRKLNSDGDYIQLLAGFFSCLTFDKKIHSCVLFWIDEFESINMLGLSNQSDTNNLLRGLIDACPNNLLIFLNLTQSSFFNVSDLSAYLSEAVKSRLKERINLEIPNSKDILLYLKDLLNNDNNRVTSTENIYFPFEQNVIEEIIKDLGNVSLRRFNNAFSLLLDIAELEEQTPINLEFYRSNKNEIIGLKEL